MIVSFYEIHPYIKRTKLKHKPMDIRLLCELSRGKLACGEYKVRKEVDGLTIKDTIDTIIDRFKNSKFRKPSTKFLRNLSMLIDYYEKPTSYRKVATKYHVTGAYVQEVINIMLRRMRHPSIVRVDLTIFFEKCDENP